LRLRPKSPHPTLDQQAKLSLRVAMVHDEDQLQRNIREAKRHLDVALDKARGAYQWAEQNGSLAEEVGKCGQRLAMVHHYLGNLHFKHISVYQALAFFNASNRLKLQYYEENHFEIGRTYHQIGLCYYRLRNYREAIENFRKAWNIRRQYNNGDAQIATLTYLGWSYLKDENLGLAKYYFEQRLGIERRLHRSTDYIHFWLAWICAKSTSREEVFEHLEAIKVDTKKVRSLKAAIDDTPKLDALMSKELREEEQSLGPEEVSPSVDYTACQRGLFASGPNKRKHDSALPAVRVDNDSHKKQRLNQSI